MIVRSMFNGSESQLDPTLIVTLLYCIFTNRVKKCTRSTRKYLYTKYRGVHGVDERTSTQSTGVYVEYGECTQSTGLYKLVRGVQASYEL